MNKQPEQASETITWDRIHKANAEFAAQLKSANERLAEENRRLRFALKSAADSMREVARFVSNDQFKTLNEAIKEARRALEAKG